MSSRAPIKACPTCGDRLTIETRDDEDADGQLLGYAVALCRACGFEVSDHHDAFDDLVYGDEDIP